MGLAGSVVELWADELSNQKNEKKEVRAFIGPLVLCDVARRPIKCLFFVGHTVYFLLFGSLPYIKLPYVSFSAQVKTASRIASCRIVVKK